MRDRRAKHAHEIGSVVARCGFQSWPRALIAMHLRARSEWSRGPKTRRKRPLLLGLLSLISVIAWVVNKTSYYLIPLDA